MRPQSIVIFQWAYLAFILLSAIATYLTWDSAIAQSVADPRLAQTLKPVFVIVTVASYLISFLLLWLVAWKASAAAKWIVTLFFVISLLGVGWTISRGALSAEPATLIGLGVLLLNAVAVVFLFRPDANRWFDGTGTSEAQAAPFE